MHRVSLQIGFGDQSAVRRHVLGQQASRLAFVEILRAVLLHPLQRARQFGLHEKFARFVDISRPQKNAVGFRKAAQPARVYAAIAPVHTTPESPWPPVPPPDAPAPPTASCRTSCWRTPSAHRPRNPRRAVPVTASCVALPGGVQVHVARGRQRRALAEIDKRGAAVRQPDQHEAAAAEVARERMGHRQRQSHRYRRVNGVAAVLQNLQPGFGGVPFARNHHAVARAHWLRGPHRYAGRHQQQS